MASAAKIGSYFIFEHRHQLFSLSNLFFHFTDWLIVIQWHLMPGWTKQKVKCWCFFFYGLIMSIVKFYVFVMKVLRFIQAKLFLFKRKEKEELQMVRYKLHGRRFILRDDFFRAAGLAAKIYLILINRNHLCLIWKYL